MNANERDLVQRFVAGMTDDAIVIFDVQGAEGRRGPEFPILPFLNSRAAAVD